MIKIFTLILTIITTFSININKPKSAPPITTSLGEIYYIESQFDDEPAFNINEYICTTPTGRAIYVGEQFGLSLPEGYILPDGVKMWDANEDYYGDFMEE